jgi:hypothetical protein
LKSKLSKSFEPLAELLPSDHAFERIKALMFYLRYADKTSESEILKAFKEARGDEIQEVFFIDRRIQQCMQREANLVLRMLKRKFSQLDL